MSKLAKQVSAPLVTLILVIGAMSCSSSNDGAAVLPATATPTAEPTSTSVAPTPQPTPDTSPPSATATPSEPTATETPPTATALPTPEPGHAGLVVLEDGRFSSVAEDGTAWVWRPIEDGILDYPPWDNGLSVIQDPDIAEAIYTAIVHMSGLLSDAPAPPIWRELSDEALLSEDLLDDLLEARAAFASSGTRRVVQEANVVATDAEIQEDKLHIRLCLHIAVGATDDADSSPVVEQQTSVQTRIFRTVPGSSHWMLSEMLTPRDSISGYVECALGAS